MTAEPQQVSVPAHPLNAPGPVAPQEDTPEALGFERQPMINWLGPAQLVSTGLKAVLAAIFGAYADQREVQAALSQRIDYDFDYSKQQELWFDYVADLGDGFDATYTVARLLSQESLAPQPAGEGAPGPAGEPLPGAGSWSWVATRSTPTRGATSIRTV